MQFLAKEPEPEPAGHGRRWPAWGFLILAAASQLTSTPVLPGANGPLIPLANAPGAALFTSNLVHQVRLQISSANLQSLRDEPRHDIRAQVTLNGSTYSNVAVHLKGRTGSFRSVDDKPGFTLDFDQFEKKQAVQGLTKLHLDNSVEDPACLNACLGAELFRRAGLPAVRMTRAEVELNGRSLGLYVLREGFTRQFLALYFHNSTGPFYEPVGAPDGPRWRCVFGPVDQALADQSLQALTGACREPDLARRREQLFSLVDVDRFLTFMALEIMLSHRDGYCLAANNYRIYREPTSSRFIFLPHGMDQLFGRPDLPLHPYFSGPVAHALMEIPEIRQQYQERAGQLFTNLLNPHLVELAAQLAVPAAQSRHLNKAERQKLQTANETLQRQIAERLKVLARQLQEPFQPEPVRFTDGKAGLENSWRAVDIPAGAQLDQASGPSRGRCLHIRAGPMTAASWRTSRWLEPGRYRFEGQACTAGVRPLPNGRNKGAGIRVTGVSARAPYELVADSAWTRLEVEFDVAGPGGDRELVCELRAIAGEAWFDLASLQLIRLK